ncbi:hypothetical protein [Nocardia salmonicida]|uniref:hypothetical protein n=1 Tax=Nocardia salmonicida TaxID=53431 RepID=UPI0036436D75
MSSQASDVDLPWMRNLSEGDTWVTLEYLLRLASPRAISLGELDDGEVSDTALDVATALDKLRETLFYDPQQIIDKEETAVRCLVEYVDPRKLSELLTFLKNNFSADTIETTSIELEDVLSFLIEWIKSAEVQVSNPRPGYHVGAVKNVFTTSEKQAFSRWSRKLREIEREGRQGEKVKRFTEQVESAAHSALVASAAAQEAAGSAGTSSLASHFSTLASDEQTRAFRWSLGTISSLVICFSAAAYFSSKGAFAADWKSIAGHLALLTPILALAGYTARIAHHHRKSQLWASTTAVQLKSVGAFVQQMPSDESRDAILSGLGARVFSAPDLPDGTATDQVAVIPAGVLDILRDLVATKKDAAGA